MTVPLPAAARSPDWSNQKQMPKSKRRFLTREEDLNRFFLRCYGITVAQRDELIEKQKGLCAICGEKKPLKVDHEHQARKKGREYYSGGKIRGLLCQNCNIGLGAFRDNPELLRKAIQYLRQ